MAQMLSWILLSLACVSHVLAQRFTIRHNNGQTECEVIAAGNKIDDTTTILKAFRECNNGGKVSMYRKAAEARTLAVVAEIRNNDCWLMTAYHEN